MKNIKKPSFLLLFLLISFGSITAVAFTPALPEISKFFNINDQKTELTMTLFLVGYTLGQLIYGPLANRLGRKKALYIAITLEIFSSLLCILSAPLHAFWLFILARFIMALAASVGLKMSFTLIADSYSMAESRKIISHLMVAFAITPAIGVTIGGFLVGYFSWVSIFYFMGIYGLVLLILTTRMPETAQSLELDALKFSKVLTKYKTTLTKMELPLAALLMGCGSSFIYVFSSLGPFIAMKSIGLNPTQYGLWNLVPAIGIIAGSQFSAYLTPKLSAMKAIFVGVLITIIGVFIMLAAFLNEFVGALFLFIPMLIVYIGLSFIFANASSIATAALKDKSNASAMMSFINIGLATFSVMILSFIHINPIVVLPIFNLILAGILLTFSVFLMVRLRLADRHPQ